VKKLKRRDLDVPKPVLLISLVSDERRGRMRVALETIKGAVSEHKHVNEGDGDEHIDDAGVYEIELSLLVLGENR
jgi:hypothetical protein